MIGDTTSMAGNLARSWNVVSKPTSFDNAGLHFKLGLDGHAIHFCSIMTGHPMLHSHGELTGRWRLHRLGMLESDWLMSG